PGGLRRDADALPPVPLRDVHHVLRHDPRVVRARLIPTPFPGTAPAQPCRGDCPRDTARSTVSAKLAPGTGRFAKRHGRPGRQPPRGSGAGAASPCGSIDTVFVQCVAPVTAGADTSGANRSRRTLARRSVFPPMRRATRRDRATTGGLDDTVSDADARPSTH